VGREVAISSKHTECQRSDTEVSVVPVLQLWIFLEGGHTEGGCVLENQIAEVSTLPDFVSAMEGMSMPHYVFFQ
jgi:hypothetical protein